MWNHKVTVNHKIQSSLENLTCFAEDENTFLFRLMLSCYWQCCDFTSYFYFIGRAGWVRRSEEQFLTPYSFLSYVYITVKWWLKLKEKCWSIFAGFFRIILWYSSDILERYLLVGIFKIHLSLNEATSSMHFRRPSFFILYFRWVSYFPELTVPKAR